MRLKARYSLGVVLSLAVLAGTLIWKGDAASAEPPAGSSAAAEQEQRTSRDGRRGQWQQEDNSSQGRAKGDRMRRVGGFLNFMNRFYTSVQDPYQATGYAALSVREHFKRQGKPLNAVAPIEKMLSSTKDQRMRNVLLFTLRQVYEEAKQEEQFIALNEQIMRENIAFAEANKAEIESSEKSE